MTPADNKVGRYRVTFDDGSAPLYPRAHLRWRADHSVKRALFGQDFALKRLGASPLLIARVDYAHAPDSRALQHVADAAHRLDVAGRAVADLVTQVADIDLDDIVVAHEARSPHSVQDSLAREHAPRMAHQVV